MEVDGGDEWVDGIGKVRRSNSQIVKWQRVEKFKDHLQNTDYKTI